MCIRDRSKTGEQRGTVLNWANRKIASLIDKLNMLDYNIPDVYKRQGLAGFAIYFLTIPVSWLPSGFSLSVFGIYCQEL